MPGDLISDLESALATWRMASSLLQFLHYHTHPFTLVHPKLNPQSPIRLDQFAIHCTSNSDPPSTNFTSLSNSTPEDDQFPNPGPTINAEQFPIEKRRRSEIIRDRKSRGGLVKPEPPNFEIGWKRTKPIPLEKPKGYVIMDFLEKLVELMEREYGSTTLLAKVGEIVAERAREEAEVLVDEGKVEERMVTELCRVLKLMEMDLAMVKAAVKEDTLNERIQQAKARCRQAILVANSF